MRMIALRAWMLCWLILVWVLLWGTISAANILSGLAIALVITLWLPLPPVPVEGRLHPLPLLRLAVTVAYYLSASSVQVAASGWPAARAAGCRAGIAVAITSPGAWTCTPSTRRSSSSVTR